VRITISTDAEKESLLILLHNRRSAQIPNALQSTVTGLKWFKIYEDGLIAANQSWGVDRMYANKGKVTFTIPPCIAAGQCEISILLY
jgi:hypothetical protein